MRELTYDQLAAELEVSPRHARNVVRIHAGLIQPIIYSHKIRRFRWADVQRLKRALRSNGIQQGRAWSAKRRWTDVSRAGAEKRRAA